MGEQLALVMEVADCKFNTIQKNKIDNPPILTVATWRMSKCKGCKKAIGPEDKEFPLNFMFRRTSVAFSKTPPKNKSGGWEFFRGELMWILHRYCWFFNKLMNKWVNSEQNIHIHLNMPCLRAQDSTSKKGTFLPMMKSSAHWCRNKWYIYMNKASWSRLWKRKWNDLWWKNQLQKILSWVWPSTKIFIFVMVFFIFAMWR